jgi:hypothetical protein
MKGGTGIAIRPEGGTMAKTCSIASTFATAACVLIVAATAAFAQNVTSAKANAQAGSHVTFNDEGIALVDGKPFFPVGIFLYELNSDVLAKLHELQCNTVLHGFRADQLDLLHAHGLMAVCPTDEAWVAAAKEHPALLAWYLTDEPENRGVTPEGERERYLALKSKDAAHPIGLCHTSFEALTTFKDACDFTMTDIYPITKMRDRDVMGVSIMMDEARRIHGRNWPQWTYIQTFGGAEADNGVWAVPLPHEVRFMAYQALVHRATGLLYFSYWPQAPRTWQSIASLNAEVQQLVPRLVAPGQEIAASADAASVQVRVRKLSGGVEPRRSGYDAGVVIAINTSPRFVQTEIRAQSLPVELSLPFEGRTVTTQDGRWSERFPPYGVHVYVWGRDPVIELARESGDTVP